MSDETELVTLGSKEERSETAENVMNAEELECLNKNHPLGEDTICGIGFLQGQWLQRFSNEKCFVGLYGLVGCLWVACFAYFNGTISTMEKRFKIPSKVSGIIVVGYDISALVVGMFLSYYAGKQHRPRWICFGIYTVVVFCFLTLLPHLLYGPGEDALVLTIEYGNTLFNKSSETYVDSDLRNLMCLPDNGHGSHCKGNEGGFNVPAIILFLGNLISGVGGGLYFNIGMSYMDDNIEKHKIPFLVSVAQFLRLLGPAVGFFLASVFLDIYIVPTLTPTIKPSDPRWLGAWWIGWILFSIVLFIAGSLLALFPKTLPAAAAREMAAIEKARFAGQPIHKYEKPSFRDMMAALWRLFTNKPFMSIQLSHMFFLFGYTPYWIFMAKYIEIQYHTSASNSSLVTGPFSIVFAAIGTLIAGAFITKYKPSARALAWWNLLVVVINTIGIASYAFIGCQTGNNHGTADHTGLLQLDQSCNANCSCDHVRYTPVCSQYGDRSYISPCHAGCSGEKTTVNGTVVYTDCTCIIAPITSITERLDPDQLGPYVLDGACPTDCKNQFLIFMCIVCGLKFTGATSRASNFLVGIRCVEERDKTVSMALSMALLSIFTFIPAPIFFGYIIDQTCVVWGKSCTGKGNCWKYDSEAMRTLLNFTAAGFVAAGAIFDIAVWYYIKDVKIFDEDLELQHVQESTEPANERLITDTVTTVMHRKENKCNGSPL